MHIKSRRVELEPSLPARFLFVRIGRREWFVGQDIPTGRLIFDRG